jgi:hypothetical protein
MNSKHRNQFNNILKCMNKRLLFLFLTMMCSACAGSTDKTLVSWVKLNKTSVKGGSILTIQDGEQFDGIILNEEGRWVPGSDELKRTESADATVCSGKMEQIATVYKGSEIRTYRNGELVTKYTAKNIDLLSSDNNFVVFGRSHYGGAVIIILSCLAEAIMAGKVLSPVKLKMHVSTAALFQLIRLRN